MEDQSNTNTNKAKQFADQILEQVQKKKHLEIKHIPNPFSYHWSATENKALKPFKVVFALIFVPIKVISIIIVLILVAIIARIGQINKGQYRTLCDKLCAFGARSILFLFGFYHVKVIGKPCAIDEASLVVVAPHSTIVDGLYLVYAYNFSGVVAKSSVANTITNPILKSMNAVLVERESREGKDRALKQLKERVQNHQGKHLIIFPEGTCTNRSCLISFKRGAFCCERPVQPVLLRYSFSNFDPAWTKKGIVFPLLLLSQFVNHLEVEFLNVYHPNDEERLNPTLYSQNVRNLMAQKLNLPCTNHSYDDVFLAKLLPNSEDFLDDILPHEFEQVKKALNISIDHAKHLLNRFLQLKKTRGVNVGEFSELLNLPLTEEVKDLFDLIDLDGNGEIDFPEFLVSLSLMNSTADEESVKFIFDVFDMNKSGKISREDFTNLLLKIGIPLEKLNKIFDIIDKEGKNFLDIHDVKKFFQLHPEMLYVALRYKARPTLVQSKKDD